MTINDLMSKIWQSPANVVEVKRLTVRHGNDNGQGDYRVIELNLDDGTVFSFTDQTGTWS